MGSKARGLCSCGVRVPERMGSVVCGMWTLSLRRTSSVDVAHGLSCPAACGLLVPRPGIEPTSPAMEGAFFTTGPPGKSLKRFIVMVCWKISRNFYGEKVNVFSRSEDQ